MNAAVASQRSSGRRQGFAAVIYCFVAAGFVFIALWLVSDLIDRANQVSGQEELLRQLVSRKQVVADPDNRELAAPGSPFLDGQTVTIAGAALQQRVDAVVKKAGGNVLSSQLDLDGPLAKDGFVRLTTNFEITQPALQKILYDIEAGMPFLFIDTLVVQAPQALGEGENGRLRVVVGAYGQWLPTQ